MTNTTGSNHNTQKSSHLQNTWKFTKAAGSELWEATKKGAASTGEAISETSAKAWEKTKEVSEQGWQATKEGVSHAKEKITDKFN